MSNQLRYGLRTENAKCNKQRDAWSELRPLKEKPMEPRWVALGMGLGPWQRLTIRCERI